MKYAVAMSAALLVAALQPALAQSPADLVSKAVAAQGGADALRALKTVSIQADAKHWDPGQSYSVSGEPRFMGDSTISMTWDLANGMARCAWDRDKKYPAVEKVKFTETVLPTLGFVADEKGVQPMSGIRLASLQRENTRTSPTLLLKALDNPQNVSAIEDQKLGSQTLPAVVLTDRGTRYIILFDRASGLPAAIRTRDDDHIYGDSNYELIPSDWKAVGAAKVAYGLSYQLNGVEVARLTYKDVTANPTIVAETFAVIFLGRFLDSDKIYYPENGGFKLSELSPNVQQVVGGTANNLIVNMKDGLVVFDAPVSDGQSRWVIDEAKKKYPGKSIKYLVLTHHHMDHTGGTRAYMAEGAQVIVPSQVKAYFEQVAAAPHTLAPDALQKQSRPAQVVAVNDTMTLKDDGVEVRIHNIPNPHVDGMIIGHVVTDNIVWVTDIWSPGRDASRTPGVLALNEAVKKLNIKDATFAGGHGSTAKQSVLDGIAAQN